MNDSAIVAAALEWASERAPKDQAERALLAAVVLAYPDCCSTREACDGCSDADKAECDECLSAADCRDWAERHFVPPAQVRETAWLIERNDLRAGQTHYYCEPLVPRRHNWTIDPNIAMRFISKSHAEVVIGTATGMHAREHIWTARTALSPPVQASEPSLMSDEQIARHKIKAGDCPPQSEVLLVSSIVRLRDRLSQIESAAYRMNDQAPPSAPDMDTLVRRFLTWKLPDDFNPDGGIDFDPISGWLGPNPSRRKPTGTNLFNFQQAKAMLEHVLALASVEPIVDANKMAPPEGSIADAN